LAPADDLSDPLLREASIGSLSHRVPQRPAGPGAQLIGLSSDPGQRLRELRILSQEWWYAAGMTVAGEMLDLQAAFDYVSRSLSGPAAIVAASFAAVSTSLSLPWLGSRLYRLVLWNPVLDLTGTFVEPMLPWGKENFSSSQQDLLVSQGFLVVDGGFELGRVVFEEFGHYRPRDAFIASPVPALIVHGDQDMMVSYAVAKRAAAAREACEFHTVSGSDHGFDSREREDEAISVTVTWLDQQYGHQP
jgi:pimeloyl-ACP methyl ester carboxylesterase